MRKIISKAVLAATVLPVAAVSASGGIASASTGCSASTIWINGNPGAEAGSWARGHSHNTGNHYIPYYYWDSGVGRYVWVYYADNNGGSDGDTSDTHYGSAACTNTPN